MTMQSFWKWNKVIHYYIITGILFFLRSITSLYAQTPEIDSLQTLLRTKLPDTQKMEVLVNIGQILQRNDPQQGISYHQQALELAQKRADNTYQAKALIAMGSCYYDLGKLDQAEATWQQALKIAQTLKDTAMLSSLHSNFGVVYETRGDLDAAIEAYEQSLDHLRHFNNPVTKAAAYNNIALVYDKQGNYTKAIEYFLSSLSDFEAASHIRGVAAVLGNIGMIYWKLKAYKDAIIYYNRSLKIKEKINDQVGMSITLNNLGGLYETIGKLDSAIYFHKKSLAIKQQLGDQLGICASYNNLGIAYYHLKDYAQARDFQLQAYQIAQQTKNKSDLARTAVDLGRVYLKLEQIALAERYLREALTLSEQVGERENILKVYQSLYELYKIRKDARALHFYERYVALNDSLRNDEQTRAITRLELQYKFDKEKEILALERAQQEALLNSQLQRQRIIRNVSLGGLGAGLVILLLLWRSYRQKQKSNRQLEIQKNKIQRALEDRETLLREIHHRVKNNLQIISSLLSLQSRQIEDPKAQEAIQEGRNRVNSIALIHKNLYQDEDLVGVDAAEYIDKLTDSLINSYNINPQHIIIKKDIDALKLDVDTIIPLGLIINELISNSLKYAFTNDQQGELNMVLKKEDKGLRLSISDNGKGLPSNFDIENLKSLGFRLVKAFTQKLEGALSVRSDHGTSVEILIPNYKAI